MSNTSSFWIQHLGLTPHPEGGYFKEVYRNENLISDVELSRTYSGKRNLATSIYFMLESGQVSKLHRLQSDEIWYFHHGAPIKVHVFDDQYSTYILGTNYQLNQLLQLIIPAGAIFGAEVIGTKTFSILGCMVSPGFHFDDFELISFQEMKTLFPTYKSIIEKLT
jgi:predicted cupin superfamily sugar epimerase